MISIRYQITVYQNWQAPVKRHFTSHLFVMILRFSRKILYPGFNNSFCIRLTDLQHEIQENADTKIPKMVPCSTPTIDNKDRCTDEASKGKRRCNARFGDFSLSTVVVDIFRKGNKNSLGDDFRATWSCYGERNGTQIATVLRFCHLGVTKRNYPHPFHPRLLGIYGWRAILISDTFFCLLRKTFTYFAFTYS